MRKDLVVAAVSLAFTAPAWSQQYGTTHEAPAQKRAPARHDVSKLPKSERSGADDRNRNSNRPELNPTLNDGPPPPGQREAVQKRREDEQRRRAMEDAQRRPTK
jgi:hypothetical protein